MRLARQPLQRYHVKDMTFLHHTLRTCKPYLGRVLLSLLVLFILLHPVGFIIGFSLGWVWDKRLRPQLTTTFTQQQLQQNKSVAFVRLAALVAKADGQVSPAEIQLFRQHVQVQEVDEEVVRLIFDQARQQHFDTARLVVDVRDGCVNAQEKRNILRLLTRIAGCDGATSGAQYTILRITAAILDIPEAVWQPWVTLANEQEEPNFGGEDALAGADPYALLGITKSATKQEIKTRYRKLIHEYHPDKLKAEGADELEIAAAEGELVKLNAAYDQLMKQG